MYFLLETDQVLKSFTNLNQPLRELLKRRLYDIRLKNNHPLFPMNEIVSFSTIRHTVVRILRNRKLFPSLIRNAFSEHYYNM